ncbi:MAG: type II toxin-antitoxin system VapC family toxin [Polyangiaceae bacterium]
MSWVLDTDCCSYALRDQHGMRSAISARPLVRLYVTTITVAEAWAGSLKSQHRDRLIALWDAFLAPFGDRILPFDEAAAKEYGAIRAHLEARGKMIGDRDCMIAAIARSRGFSLVSHNSAEHRRIPDLRVEGWLKKT